MMPAVLRSAAAEPDRGGGPSWRGAAGDVHDPRDSASGSGTLLPDSFLQWLLFLFVAGLITVSNVSGLSRLMVLIGIVMCLFFVIFLLYHKRFPVHTEVVLYGAWICWSFGGLTNVRDTSLFSVQMITALQIAAMMFTAAGITAISRNISSSMFAILTGGCLLVLSTLISGQFQEIALAEERARMTGLAANANNFAYQCLFGSFAAMYFLQERYPRILRIGLLLPLLMFFGCIIFSGSRNMLISFIAFIFLWWVICHRKKLPRNPLKAYSLLMILLIGSLAVADYIVSRTLMGQRLGEMDSHSNAVRLQMYEEGLLMIMQYPVFGVGLNNYRTMSSSGLYSHSDYVEVAANTGLVGFVIHFSIYAVLLLRIHRIRAMTSEPRVRYVTGMMTAVILTILLSGFGLPHVTSKLTWVFLALASGYSSAIERDIVMALRTDHSGMGTVGP